MLGDVAVVGASVIQMLGLATDVGFIDLDDAHELVEFAVDHADAHAVAHVPR